ncbi:hypothetical protein PZ895_14010 [Mesorhizobium sp. YIM 152430]|nr:hypothetical protein [Mesorhizobium sp. YIM 152430]MDF1600879.1 hypothetical protein [Mesorhizobium sp. YIM 152430]
MADDAPVGHGAVDSLLDGRLYAATGALQPIGIAYSGPLRFAAGQAAPN